LQPLTTQQAVGAVAAGRDCQLPVLAEGSMSLPLPPSSVSLPYGPGEPSFDVAADQASVVV